MCGQAYPELILSLVSRMKSFRKQYGIPGDNSDLDYNLGLKIRVLN